MTEAYTQLSLFATEKRCKACGEMKPTADFNRDRTKTDGRRAVCKQCMATLRRARRIANPDPIRERERRWREKNRDLRRLLDKAYYRANREVLLAYRKRHYEQHKPKRLEQARAYYRANAERIKENVQRYQATHPITDGERSRRRALARQRYWSDPEVARKKVRSYRERHPDAAAQSRKKWAERHPERAQISKQKQRQTAGKAYKRKRRAMLLNAPVNDLTAAQWREILVYFNHRCAYCGSQESLCQDHVIPLSKGGAHTASNIVPACRSCNSAKGNRPLWTMIESDRTLPY